jgi:SAM-dependent methyltransferase
LNLRFELSYLLGFSPWDRWHARLWEPLHNLIEGPESLPPGRAIDLGCGMGHLSIYLAQHGWQVTGVDAVERALRVARRRAAKYRVDVEFIHADVRRLDQAGVVGPFELLLDFGCFHTMSQNQRSDYVESVTAVAAENAQLLLFALGPAGVLRLWPRGAERADVERHFSSCWSIVWGAAEEKMPGKLPPAATATWYLLKRKGSPGA